MAITLTLSNHYKYQLMKKRIDLSADTLIMILMDNTFAFDKDAHATLADIAADQLATANGYTQNAKELANKVLTEDDANDKGKMVCDDVSWTASGGSFGPTGAAVILDFSAIDDTEFFTTEIDRTFTGGATHWANGDLGTTFDETTDLSLVASSVGQYCKITFTDIGTALVVTFTDIGTALVAGGRYRLQYDYSEATAGFEFKINGAALQTLGDAVAGTSQVIDFVADESFTGAHELRIYSKTGAAAAGDFDNFSLKQIATVVGCSDYGTDYTINENSSFLIKDIEVATS
jgi:hypothetical protein